MTDNSKNRNSECSLASNRESFELMVQLLKEEDRLLQPGPPINSCIVSNKIEPNKTRHNLPLPIIKSRMKVNEMKPSGSKIFANYAAQIRGDTNIYHLQKFAIKITKTII